MNPRRARASVLLFLTGFWVLEGCSNPPSSKARLSPPDAGGVQAVAPPPPPKGPPTLRMRKADCKVHCDLDEALKALAGPDAESCGEPHGPSGTACASGAQKAGHGFFAIQSEQGVDSPVISAWVQTATGETYQVNWDGDSTGTGRRCQQALSKRACDKLSFDKKHRRWVCEGSKEAENTCRQAGEVELSDGASEDASALRCARLTSGQEAAVLGLQQGPVLHLEPKSALYDCRVDEGDAGTPFPAGAELACTKTAGALICMGPAQSDEGQPSTPSPIK